MSRRIVIEHRPGGSRPWKLVREDTGQIVKSAAERDEAQAVLVRLIGRPRRSGARRRAQKHRDRRTAP